MTFDPPDVLAVLRREERLDAVVADAGSDLETFERLMDWTRHQWEPGTPNPYPPLNARIILKDIRRGFTSGFCAQYNYVLAQSMMSLGYKARYVTLIDHEVIEAWLPAEGRWICLDPLYDAMYLDDKGRPLSVLEITLRVRSGAPPAPSPGCLEGAAEMEQHAFRQFAVWLRNDHISHPINFTDIERYKVHFRFDGEPVPDGLSTSYPIDLYPGF